jgi:ubiquinone/menaquinone biosynthesis C-methylase UbiE
MSERYFSARNTVISWWDPLSDDDIPFKQYSILQQEDLLSRCPVAGKRILDCCTGRGRMAIAAALNGAASVIGLDVSDDMLAVARSNAHYAEAAVEFRFGNASNMAIDDESVDVVFCLEAMLHLDDPWRVVKEFYRVLVRDGYLIATTVGANPLARLTQPPRKGAHPAGRVVLTIVTVINQVMTSLFGFMWRRTRLTGRLYSKIFRVPVRPLYRSQVFRMLEQAGFCVQRWDIKSGPFTREHRWMAYKPLWSFCLSRLKRIRCSRL